MCKSKERQEPLVDFIWTANDEPHRTRRMKILEKYPQVRQLFGPCISNFYKVSTVVLLQILGCMYVSNKSWAVVVFLAYVVSGSFNHSMTLAIHELSHNLAFKGQLANRWLCITANLPLTVPAAVSFKRYHAEHHRYQGEDEVDVDLPTLAEAKFFRTAPRKLLWLFLQPLFYSLRPYYLNPKNPTFWEFVNLIVCILFDLFIYYFFGIKGISYLMIGTYLGLSLHPTAGHFIAEHYAFNPNQETYSYYGPLNWLSFNSGYHNEHHDFPYIPASRLHQLKEMAPDFYDTIDYHESWTKVIWTYITDPKFGPWTRIKRHILSPEELQELHKRSKNT